jgi:hypothetical protein
MFEIGGKGKNFRQPAIVVIVERVRLELGQVALDRPFNRSSTSSSAFVSVTRLRSPRGATAVGYPLPSHAPSDIFSIQIAAPSATVRVRRPSVPAAIPAHVSAAGRGLTTALTRRGCPNG